jgi:hypothetical protein
VLDSFGSKAMSLAQDTVSFGKRGMYKENKRDSFAHEQNFIGQRKNFIGQRKMSIGRRSDSNGISGDFMGKMRNSNGKGRVCVAGESVGAKAWGSRGGGFGLFLTFRVGGGVFLVIARGRAGA